MSRKNISLSTEIEQRAQWIIRERGFDGLSDLIASLVREEFERKSPPAAMREAPVSYGPGLARTTTGAEVTRAAAVARDIVDSALSVATQSGSSIGAGKSRARKARRPKAA